MTKEREPAKIREYERDGEGRRKHVLKSFHKKANSHLSLKEYARQAQGDKDADLSTAARNWLFNKKANTSKPPLGIGCTRKKKGGSKPSGK